MRNAAMTLGLIGGLLGMMVGFFSFGYTEALARYSELGEVFGEVQNPALIRTVALLGPLLAIAGAAMAKIRALWGGGLMLVSAVLMYFAFGYGVFTMFPLAMTGLGGILALAAGRPDEPKSHF